VDSLLADAAPRFLAAAKMPIVNEEVELMFKLLLGLIPAPCNGLTLSAIKASEHWERDVAGGWWVVGFWWCGSCEVPANSSIIKFERFCTLTKAPFAGLTGKQKRDIQTAS